MFDSDSDEGIVYHFNPSKSAVEEQSLLGREQNEAKISSASQDSDESPSKYPKTVFLILGTEFCERFNYYGMRAILVIYLIEWLGLQYNSAVAMYHMFSMLAFFSPILGAVIADGYLGRFRTIFYISIVYALGTLIMSLTALPPAEIYGPVVGLLLISLGTGGIKPCVSALGGDQFSTGQESERQTFFSLFYFFINLGSMLATIVTPILRADVHCIEDKCYPLAFGAPAVLMCLSLVIFFAGKNHYKLIPPTGNLFKRVFGCIWTGLKLRFKLGKYAGKDNHWLNYAEEVYENSFIEDVKALLKVLWLFIPLPLFWALYDQQGSRWTLQAMKMNGDAGHLGRIKPDQLQVVNPILILLLIPLFEKLVYPCLNKHKIPNRPLQRMCTGMILCCLAFLIAGFVQLRMDYITEAPLNGKSGVTFISSINCSVKIESPFYNHTQAPFVSSPFLRTSPGDTTISFVCEEWKTENSSTRTFNYNLRKNQAYRIVIHYENGRIQVSSYPDNREVDNISGKAKLSVINFLSNVCNDTIWIKPYINNKTEDKGALVLSIPLNRASNFSSLELGQYQIVYESPDSESSSCNLIAIEPVLDLREPSVQTVVLRQEPDNGLQPPKVSALHFQNLQSRRLSMGWLIPQYFFLTVGEILFSITGLAFVYSQAPSSMKSVLQAIWHLCVAIGNLIVFIEAESNLMPSKSNEFFMFAGVMGLNVIVFIVMAYLYKGRPVDPDSEPLPDTVSLVKAESSGAISGGKQE